MLTFMKKTFFDYIILFVLSLLIFVFCIGCDGNNDYVKEDSKDCQISNENNEDLIKAIDNISQRQEKDKNYMFCYEGERELVVNLYDDCEENLNVNKFSSYPLRIRLSLLEELLLKDFLEFEWSEEFMDKYINYPGCKNSLRPSLEELEKETARENEVRLSCRKVILNFVDKYKQDNLSEHLEELFSLLVEMKELRLDIRVDKFMLEVGDESDDFTGDEWYFKVFEKELLESQKKLEKKRQEVENLLYGGKNYEE